MGIRSSKNNSQHETLTEASKVVITSSDRAQLELKLQRDKLTAVIKRYETIAQEERTKASDLLRSGNRRKALYCLKRERAQKSLATGIADMLDNVQRLIDTVEFHQIEMEVFVALKNGKDELSRLNSMLNIDDIIGLMEDTAETIEESRRIDSVLAQPLDGYEDDALLNELLLQGSAEISKDKHSLEEVVIPTHKLPEEVRSDIYVTENEVEEARLLA